MISPYWKQLQIVPKFFNYTYKRFCFWNVVYISQSSAIHSCYRDRDFPNIRTLEKRNFNIITHKAQKEQMLKLRLQIFEKLSM